MKQNEFLIWQTVFFFRDSKDWINIYKWDIEEICLKDWSLHYEVDPYTWRSQARNDRGRNTVSINELCIFETRAKTIEGLTKLLLEKLNLAEELKKKGEDEYDLFD